MPVIRLGTSEGSQVPWQSVVKREAFAKSWQNSLEWPMPVELL